MAAKTPRSPHHLVHVEEAVGSKPLREMQPGQVFVREGTPHMMLALDSSTRVAVGAHHSVGDALYVVNLITGAAWPLNAKEQVYPATEAKLTFKSSRRSA